MSDTETIYLRLGTADRITLTDFIDSLSDFKNVLQELDATIANDKRGNMIWEVVALEKHSPAVVGVAPKLKQGREDVSMFVERQLIENTRLLSTKGERTDALSDRALGKIQRLSSRTVRTGSMAVYLNGNGPVRASADISTQTYDKVIQLTGVKYSEYGSIYGNLDTISVHRGHEFRIWNEENNKSVKCVFSPDGLESVKSFLGSKVIVTGTVQLNAAKLPIAIKVDDLREAPQIAVPTIDEMIGFVPHITEGLSLKEYMKRLSNE
jgi:hypothetical protein